MTSILVTIDTELSVAAHQRGVGLDENLERAILGRVSDGEWGVAYQSKELQSRRLKSVFFVEALSASVFGIDTLKRTVDPILSRDQEVQLHIHSEWLPWFAKDPVDGRRGRCMADFPSDDQCRLLEIGLENLARAGVPRVTAFRAGNFGANNETLRSLASLGLRSDSSYNLAYIGDTCRIVTERPLYGPHALQGVVEVPITCFRDLPNHHRPMQVCAISISEMRTVLDKSRAQNRSVAVIVSHSFELLNRARTKSNQLLVRRFTALCDHLQRGFPGAATSFISEFAETVQLEAANDTAVTSSALRTGSRMLQQALSNLIW